MGDEFQLPADTLEKIKRANAVGLGAESLLKKAKAAGFDVESRLNDISKQREQLRKMRDVFFPGEQI